VIESPLRWFIYAETCRKMYITKKYDIYIVRQKSAISWNYTREISIRDDYGPFNFYPNAWQYILNTFGDICEHKMCDILMQLQNLNICKYVKSKSAKMSYWMEKVQFKFQNVCIFSSPSSLQV